VRKNKKKMQNKARVEAGWREKDVPTKILKEVKK
jgi:hypothetical protein